MNSQPTDLPAHGRFDKTIPIPHVPADGTLPVVFRAAARLIARNGLHQGDWVFDAFNRSATTAHCDRPLSIVAAVRCVTTGNPHRTSPLADRAVAELADHLVVDDDHASRDATADQLAAHVDHWGDHDGRTTESAVAVLEHAADRHEGEWAEMRYQLGHFDADAACRATVDFKAVA